jgi:LysR family glycine cleavage system transcriptional activator
MILSLPFSALRAFEAVVRLRSFSAAAGELGVSQSAISQHVKTLEDWLGQELLVRGARQSKPTRAGAQLAQAVSEGLGRISEVCGQLRDKQRSDRTITISCLPGFAYNWLFPRLSRFDLAHPDLSISIATDTGDLPFASTEADVGIWYGKGAYPGLTCDLLMHETLFPVCAPSLLPRLQSIEELVHHTILIDENLPQTSYRPAWEFWAQDQNITLPPARRARRLGQANMVVQAAIEGLGVAMGREPLVIDALCDGRLVRPFPHVTKSVNSYWLVRKPGAQADKKVAVFLDWIASEAAAQPSLPPPTAQPD